MREEERSVPVNDFEHRLMIKGLSEFRNNLIRDGKPTEDVDDLLLKILDTPRRTCQRTDSRDER